MINWKMGAAQFGALWYGTGLDRYPFPFDIVSGFTWRDDAERFEQQVRDAFAGSEHERMRAAVSVLANPEVHVAVSGRTAANARIRVIGAQAQRYAAIAVQQPGPDDEQGGDVTLGFGPAGRLAGQIVGVLPPNAGGTSEFKGPTEPAEDSPRGFTTTVAVSRRAARLEQVLATRHAGDGTIRVWSGPRYGRQSETGQVRWIDIAGDGRYVIGPRDRTRAAPADPQRLSQIVDGLLERASEELKEGQSR
ncbi:ESX secretion-associated protein EspG [Aldersonia sp. NBC_00410]|uniref:ESX secretion-associated protein EspG n=1 Tax=Aldersonia sp. NBC_00410 TaxID=2975954 RepID=UPI00224DCFFC|nr:ESX secretion-associated protein EspG [Aldersonia sp. NBC_00410]MCX5042276.1 ESX secretion-associated protein EspG [Aldersonia sp. NBC_00410]